jgi:hypothetical protein
MICPYCGEHMHRTGEVPKRPKGMPRPQWRAMHKRRIATRDHILPRSRGGAGQRTVRVCHQCNMEKGALTLSEYRAVLTRSKRMPHLFHFERQIPRLLVTVLCARMWWIVRLAF